MRTLPLLLDLGSKNKFHKSLEPDGVHFLSTFDEWRLEGYPPKDLCSELYVGIFWIPFFARSDPLPEQNMWLIYEFVGGKGD